MEEQSFSGRINKKGGVGMETICSLISDNTVYPILIKNDGKAYLTLFYYTERSDSVLHKNNILYFSSEEEMSLFCRKYGLKQEGGISEYDFDTPILNPVDYRRVLENWNLLNTISATFGMFFEGNLKKYTSLYDLLFRLDTASEPIPQKYNVKEKYLSYLLKIFKKKNRLFERFELYREK